MAAIEAPTCEPVQVWAAESGAPERLVWRGRRFRVTRRPVAWVGRRAWWSSVSRAPVGVGAAVLEQLVWQVDAEDADGDRRMFELLPGPGGRWWLLDEC